MKQIDIKPCAGPRWSTQASAGKQATRRHTDVYTRACLVAVCPQCTNSLPQRGHSLLNARSLLFWLEHAGAMIRLRAAPLEFLRWSMHMRLVEATRAACREKQVPVCACSQAQLCKLFAGSGRRSMREYVCLCAQYSQTALARSKYAGMHTYSCAP